MEIIVYKMIIIYNTYGGGNYEKDNMYCNDIPRFRTDGRN